MAAPSYSTDLTTSLVGNLGTESWDESSNAAWDDGGAMVDDANLYYINAACVSAQFTKDGVGSIIGDIGSNITVPTDGAILVHHLWAAPPALQSYASGGVFLWIGSSFGDAKIFHVSGNDKSPAPEGGWATYAVDPAQTHQQTVGTQPTTYRYIGGGVKATAQARGNPHAVNAVRYGRCKQIYTAGDATTPATFDGYAAIDRASSARYNLLQTIPGGYKFRGLMSIGTSSTAVYFEDSDVSITIADDPRVSANFNRIEMVNAGSTVKWTNISYTALGTVSKGQFEMIDNVTLIDVGGVFTGMSTFIYQSNASVTGRTYRRCDQITQGAAAFDGCLITDSTDTYALSSDAPNSVTNTTFANNATALYLPASVTGTITLSGDVFTNNTTDVYWAGTSGTLYINSPSVSQAKTATAGGTIVVQNSVVLTIEANVSLVGAEVRIYDYNGTGGSLGDELSGIESNSSSNFVYGGSGGNVIWIQVMLANYVEYGAEFTMPSSDGSTKLTLVPDLND